MAKNTGRLAGLAALAGAAYMMSKGKDKEVTPSGSTRAARPESTETGRMSDEDKAEMKRETQRGPISSIPSKPSAIPVITPSIKTEDLKPVSEPSDKRVKLAPENRDLETNMTRGMQTPPAPVSPSVSAVPVLPLGSSDTKTYERKKGATASEIKNYRNQQDAQARMDALRASGGRRAAGGAIKKMAKGGMTSMKSSPSKRADGIASRGKTKCKMY